MSTSYWGLFFLRRRLLVRPDLFDPEKDGAGQLARLRQAMIRNNKAAVTDLQGNRLFQPVTVHNREYRFSEAESRFYQTLSAFILDGRAYAATLDGRAQTARMLVLTTLQKLAASSIAAIRHALRRRRAMLASVVGRADADDSASVGLPDDQATLDEVAEAEEALPGTAAIVLMKDEIQRLGDLVALTEEVVAETKIDRLVALVRDELPAAEPVLLFTEYKTTQALVVNALHRQFGFGKATFINGDDRLDRVERAAGGVRTVSQPREQAAEAFNAGRVRFLVSTEAGGEGIDLQERCAVLVHVDMPWNPMRLHQRVGRLSRYGQRRPVSVYILRNPDTVEARIWDLLNEKLERVQRALSAVMEQQVGHLATGRRHGRPGPLQRAVLRRAGDCRGTADGLVRQGHGHAGGAGCCGDRPGTARQRVALRLSTGRQGPAAGRRAGPRAVLHGGCRQTPAARPQAS